VEHSGGMKKSRTRNSEAKKGVSPFLNDDLNELIGSFLDVHSIVEWGTTCQTMSRFIQRGDVSRRWWLTWLKHLQTSTRFLTDATVQSQHLVKELKGYPKNPLMVYDSSTGSWSPWTNPTAFEIHPLQAVVHLFEKPSETNEGVSPRLSYVQRVFELCSRAIAIAITIHRLDGFLLDLHPSILKHLFVQGKGKFYLPRRQLTFNALLAYFEVTQWNTLESIQWKNHRIMLDCNDVSVFAWSCLFRRLSRNQRLVEFHFEGGHLTDSDLEVVLDCFPNLKRLVLTSPSDHFWSILLGKQKDLPHLNHIEFSPFTSSSSSPFRRYPSSAKEWQNYIELFQLQRSWLCFPALLFHEATSTQLYALAVAIHLRRAFAKNHHQTHGGFVGPDWTTFASQLTTCSSNLPSLDQDVLKFVIDSCSSI
jgi:hypothetical protein